MGDNFNDHWDPMREDYYNESVNSYDTGPGSRLPKSQQPANFRKGESQSTKLYLYPLSDAYTRESLNNMFSKFGEVTEVYIDNKTHKWAFIYMKTQAAAERAIRELNGHPQLGFKLQYAREKSDSASVAASETGSPAELNRRKSEDISQTGNQFIEGFKRKQNLDRSINGASDVSERANFNNNQQTPTNMMNGDISIQPVPNCLHCKRQTVETCTKCLQPFCSRDCMIRKYDGHIDQCILSPPHSSQLKCQVGISPGQLLKGHIGILPSQPFSAYSTISQDFADTSQNYVNHHFRSSTINSCYKDDDDVTDYGACDKDNSLPRTHDKKTTAAVHSRKSDMRKPISNESSKNGGNIRMNGTHATKENRPDNFSSSKNTAITGDEDSFIEFDHDNKGGKKNVRVKRERDNKSNHSNKEKASSRLNRTPPSGRSTQESESSINSQPRNRASKEHEPSWNSESEEVSGHRSKKEKRSPMCSERLSFDNHSKTRASKECELSGGNQSQESGVSACRLKKENQSSISNESPSPKHSGNRYSNDTRVSDDETGVPLRLNRGSQWDIKPTFDKIDNFDASSRSTKSEFSSTRSSKPECPEFSPLSRVEIKENARFEVKLAEGDEITAIMITQENESLNSMIDTLQKFDLEPVQTFSRGLKCVAKRTRNDHGTWYRCLVHSVDPLSVRFIDFSHDPVIVQEEDVRKMPEEFVHIYPFAYRVNFRNAVKEKLSEFKNSSFEVVFVSKERNVWNVDLVEKPFNDKLTEARSIRDARKQSSESPKKSQNSNQKHSDLKIILKKDIPTEVYVTHIEESSKKVFVTISDKLKILLELIAKQKSDSMPELETLRLNAMCLAFYYDCWYRARIVSLDPLKVYYVDFGNTELAKKSDLKRVPEEFMWIDPLAVAVKFKNETECSVEIDKSIKIIPIEELTAEKMWLVRLVSEPEKSEKQSTAQEPPGELNQSYAPKAALNDILEVQVTYPVSLTEYYVGPKDISDQLMAVSITDADVQKMKPLETPSVGTLCLRSYDGVWSRAKIVSLDPLTIYFLDFGNQEKVHIKDLYPLSEKYRSIPPLAFKIHLQEPKDLPEYVPFKIKKVSEKFWTVINESSEPKINSNVS